MTEALNQISTIIYNIFNRPTFIDIIDIILVSVVVYKLLEMTRQTRANQVLKGLGVIVFVSWMANIMGLQSFDWLLQQVISTGVIVMVILFQPELRRALESIGRGATMEGGRTDENHYDGKRSMDEIIKAIMNMSRRKVGALILIKRKTGLDDIIQTGTRVDALISADMLENIFEPNTPLHDGAVVIDGERIAAAACFLQIAEGSDISRELGTRHRAALGISETTDVISLIVSEESGIISMARSGKLTRYLDANALESVLSEVYSPSARTPNLLSTIRRKVARHGKD